MFTMTRSVPVNDRNDPDIPVLNRDQVWKGLELKAGNALPFGLLVSDGPVQFRPSHSKEWR